MKRYFSRSKNFQKIIYPRFLYGIRVEKSTIGFFLLDFSLIPPPPYLYARVTRSRTSSIFLRLMYSLYLFKYSRSFFFFFSRPGKKTKLLICNGVTAPSDQPCARAERERIENVIRLILLSLFLVSKLKFS